ncbi:MAG: glycosyltransferase [Eubacterium sp.]|nr:glycosyltransferase [Eubacterium sp.]
MEQQTKQKSIAFYIGSLSRGGAERVIVNLAEYFHSSGYRVTIVTKLQDEVEYPVPEGVTRILADITGDEISKNRITNLYRRIARLRRIWKQLRPDHIVSFIKKNNFMAITSSIGMKIPVIVSVRSNPAREYPDKLTRLLVRILFSRAAGVVLQTQQAVEFFPKVVKKKAVVLPNSLSEQFLQVRYSKARKKEIVWVGRMDANKNPKMLLNVFGKIAEQYPDWSLTYIGDGPQLNELKEMCREKPYEKQVTFLGKIDQVAREIGAASIFVLTSKQEGMPNALMEAMVSGLAAISTDCPCGGPAELIQNEENGILIPVDDEMALEAALKRLIDEDAYREKIGENAKGLIQKVHPDTVNRQWLEYVESTARR